MFELKNIVIVVLLASTIILAILYTDCKKDNSRNSDTKQDLQSHLNQPGKHLSKSERCFLTKAATSVRNDQGKLGSLIGLSCAESINAAIKSNDFSKVPPTCMKYFSEFPKNYKKWAIDCV